MKQLNGLEIEWITVSHHLKRTSISIPCHSLQLRMRFCSRGAFKRSDEAVHNPKTVHLLCASCIQHSSFSLIDREVRLHLPNASHSDAVNRTCFAAIRIRDIFAFVTAYPTQRDENGGYRSGTTHTLTHTHNLRNSICFRFSFYLFRAKETCPLYPLTLKDTRINWVHWVERKKHSYFIDSISFGFDFYLVESAFTIHIRITVGRARHYALTSNVNFGFCRPTLPSKAFNYRTN